MRWIVPTAVIAFFVASAWGAGSGIRVTVTSSPTCPVETMPPQPGCGPKPVDARIRVVSRTTHHTVARTRTGEDGKASIRLAAGRYRVYAAPANGRKLPRCGSAPATVRKGRYSRTSINCDSGIR